MCGIITVIKKEDDNIPTAATVSGMLIPQLHRGTQGFGFVSFDDVVSAYVRRTTRYEIESILENNTARSIMFHHRFPTSTPNYADCAHPIWVAHEELTYDYYMIHNGHVSNDKDLHDKHIAMGYEYTTNIENIIKTKNHSLKACKWNDSEALAIDLARFIEGKQSEIESLGSIAFVMLQVEKTSKKVVGVFYGRNSSPLTINFTERHLVLRSEGERDIVQSNMLYRLDIKTWKLEGVEVPIGSVMSVGRSQWERDLDEYNRDDKAYASKDLPPLSPAVQEVIDGIDDDILKLDDKLAEAYDEKTYYEELKDIANLTIAEEKIKEIEDKIEVLEEDKEILIQTQLD